MMDDGMMYGPGTRVQLPEGVQGVVGGFDNRRRVYAVWCHGAGGALLLTQAFLDDLADQGHVHPPEPWRVGPGTVWVAGPGQLPKVVEGCLPDPPWPVAGDTVRLVVHTGVDYGPRHDPSPVRPPQPPRRRVARVLLYWLGGDPWWGSRLLWGTAAAVGAVLVRWGFMLPTDATTVGAVALGFAMVVVGLVLATER